MVILKEAKYVDEFKVKLRFDDGVVKVVDLKAKLEGEIFEPLNDPDYFAQFKYDSELGTIVWENGADLAPEFLYALDAV